MRTDAALYIVPAFVYRVDVYGAGEGAPCEVLRWGRGAYDCLGEAQVKGHKLVWGPGGPLFSPVAEALVNLWLDRTLSADPCANCGACAPHHVVGGGGQAPIGLVCRFCRVVTPWPARCGAAASCAGAPRADQPHGPLVVPAPSPQLHRRRRALPGALEPADGCTVPRPAPRPFVHLWIPDREFRMGPPEPRCALCGALRDHHPRTGCRGRRMPCETRP